MIYPTQSKTATQLYMLLHVGKDPEDKMDTVSTVVRPTVLLYYSFFLPGFGLHLLVLRMHFYSWGPASIMVFAR